MTQETKAVKCQYPNCTKPGIKRRQRTAYVNDESNFVMLCEEHHKENDEYWNEQWEEYYRDLY
jgi:hypothetical protein